MKTVTKVILLLIAVFIVTAIFYILNSPYRINRIAQWIEVPIEKEIFVRGSIITDDNITIAYTQKVYHLSLLSDTFDKDEFLNLMIEISKVVKVNINSRISTYFKEIKKEEFRIVVYAMNEEQMQKVKIILDSAKKSEAIKKQYYAFTLSGEKRIYPYKDMLTPIIGYNQKLSDSTNNFTYLKGRLGIEKEYNHKLSSYDKFSEHKNIILNIDFQLQQEKERELDYMKLDLNASEVMSIVLDVDTFKIKVIASSNRYNPKNIKREDFHNLHTHAVVYKFDIGDFLDPINRAINNENILSLEEGYKEFGLKDENLKVNFMQLINMYGVFYNEGKIANSRVVKQKNPYSPRQIISKENAKEIKKRLPSLLAMMKDESFKVEYRDRNMTGSIYIDYFQENSKNYLEAYFIIDAKDILSDDEVSSIETPADFPYKITLQTSSSPSNITHTYIFHSKADKNRKIGKITRVLNKYQTNNRNASEAIVEGIYSDDNGNYFIDRLTGKGTELAKCNACQTYNVETYEISKDGIFLVNRRAFDIKTYKPYRPEKVNSSLLSIDNKLQRKIESVVDKAKVKYDAKEVLIGVMNSSDGKLLSLVSSDRANSTSAAEYLFQPGFVMTPIVLAQLLDTNKTQVDEMVNAHNGHYKFKNKIIKDSKKFVSMKAIESITNHSSIVISQLAQRLSGDEYYMALGEFGLHTKSARQLNNAMNKAIVSYGYGMNTSMLQLMKAYNVFNTDGMLIKVSILKDTKSEKVQIISLKTSKEILNALHHNVQNISSKIDISGFSFGGMNSSSHIIKEGKYSNDYVHSFFGFANDKHNNKYTIGIVLIEPKNEKLSSKTTVPVFFDVLKELK